MPVIRETPQEGTLRGRAKEARKIWKLIVKP